MKAPSLLFQASSVAAYAWVAGQPGANLHFSGSRTPYLYAGAKNGTPGTGVGGIRVPANGDTAHAYSPPDPNDIRGPCPDLNVAANVSTTIHTWYVAC